MATARALTFRGPRDVAIEEVELPEPGGGRALVRTEYSGISGGTELLAYRGEIDGDVTLDESFESMAGTFSYPFRYGYSCVGRLEHRLQALKEGDLVFAFHAHQDRILVPGSDLVGLPEIDARTATLFPLVETALQVSLEVRAGSGRSLVVLGMGPVGLLAALLLVERGGRVVCGEPRRWRRQLAAGLGLTCLAPEDLSEAVGQGATCVIEASGDPRALASALSLLAHEGAAVVVSWYGSKPVTLPLGRDFHRRRLTIRSVQVSTIPSFLAPEWTIARRRAEAARLLRALPLGALATHEFAFEDAAKAFAALDRGEEGLMHAALRYARPGG